MCCLSFFCLLYLGVVCRAFNSSDANVSIPPGYWRISLESHSILRCPWGATSCFGGQLVGANSCSEGYVGPMCSTCDEDYYLSVAGETCNQCSVSHTFFSFLLILPGAVLIPFLIVFYYGRSNDVSAEISLLSTLQKFSSKTKSCHRDDSTVSISSQGTSIQAMLQKVQLQNDDRNTNIIFDFAQLKIWISLAQVRVSIVSVHAALTGTS